MLKILMCKKHEQFLTLSKFSPPQVENPFKQEKEKMERPTHTKMGQAWNGSYPFTPTK